jgi:signal transduction histidine kinase
MRGRGTVVAIVLLGAVLAVVFSRLLSDSRELLVEAERERRHQALQDAVAALGAQTELAQTTLRELANARPVWAVLAARADPDGPAGAGAPEAYAQLDALLPRLAKEEAILTLSLLPVDDGHPLAAFSRADRSLPAPLSPAAPPSVSARAAQSPGSVVYDLRQDGGPRLIAALAVERGSVAILLVELDVAAALARCAQGALGQGDAGEAAEGAWGLVDGGGTLLWPPADELGADGARALESARAGAAEQQTTLVDDALITSLRVSSSLRPNWLLVSRSLVSTRQVTRELGWYMALAAASVVLVLAIGLGGAEARARETYLQKTLEETGKQERFLQAIFDAITDSLVVVGTDLQVLRANRVARERWGEELVGRGYGEVFGARRGPEDDDPADGVRWVASHGRPRLEEVHTGAQVWALAQYPIFAPNGSVRGVVEYARDVTQTRHLQAQLVQTEKLSTLGEMAAGIAHEINNPVGVISMFAQLLSEEVRERLGEDAPALEQIQTIEEQATNVGEIVKNLLRFARKSEGQKVRFDVRGALDRAMSIVEHQKILDGVTVERRTEVEPPPFVMGDEGQLAQVLLNLVVNASHALEGSGTLTLAVRCQADDAEAPPGRAFGDPPQGARVLISVSDTGSGIDPEHVERIFEPFYTTKSVGKGTGLGLSVGFGIVRDHGGCIWLDSQPDQGTTFSIDLPAAPAEQPLSEPDPQLEPKETT